MGDERADPLADFVSYPLELEGPYAPPVTPRKVAVRCSTVKPNGRIVPLVTTIENLPQHCTVRDLQLLMYDFLSVSIRNPMELRYWGKTLDPDKMLKHYAIKEHSEITVVVKPKLPEGVPCGSSELLRIRFSSHNLQAPLAVDGVSNDLTVLDLKRMLQAQLKAAPIFLALEGQPEDERTGTMAMSVGDHFVTDNSGPGAKGKGVLRMRRVKDNVVGMVNDVQLAELKLEPEQMNLLHGGLVMPDEALLGTLGLVNNERLYLDFKPPWPQPWIPEEGAAPPKEKGGGKKKK